MMLLQRFTMTLSAVRLPLAALAGSALVLGVLVAAPSLSHAGGVVGNGTPASCTEAALDSALVGGGQVTFNCGGPKTILLTTEKVISQATSIDGGGAVVLSGTQTVRAFQVQGAGALALSNITLSHFAGPAGGAIYNAGNLSLLNTTIQNSKSEVAGGAGGAILTLGPLTIMTGTFKDNSAQAAGAVYAQGPIDVNITSSVFQGNKAIDQGPNGKGGAIQLSDGADVNITSGQFFFNTARNGGALFVPDGSKATLRSISSTNRLAFAFNAVTEDGGAIWNAGTLDIKTVEFNGNAGPTNVVAAGYGGAIAVWGGSMMMDDTVFSLNTGRFGGAVYNGPAQSTIVGTRFSKNTSSSMGGGLYASNTDGGVTITQSIFNQNQAATGGGIARFNSAMSISATSLYSNSATGEGGGLYVGAGPAPTVGRVLVNNTTFSGNTANQGTGGGVHSNGQIDLYYTTIKGNSPSGVRSAAGNLRLRGTVLENPGHPNCIDFAFSISNDLYNFSTDATCGPSIPAGGASAGLGPLTGSTTQTFYHPVLPGSLLLNKALSHCLPSDQRGASRSTPCEIGAVESSAKPILDVVGQTTGTYSMYVLGSNFLPGAVVLWNGQPRETVFIDSTRLVVTFLPDDLKGNRTGTMSVQNPGPYDEAGNAKTVTLPTLNLALPVVAANRAIS